MKTFSTLILATLAVAAFVAESADAVQVHAHRGQPVMKKVNLAKHQRPAKLVASDLEADGDNVLSDPFAEGPIGNTLAFDDEPPTTKSNDGSGSNEDGSTDGSNEDSSADGSNEDSSADGSGGNNDGSADEDNGSGPTDTSAAKPPASKGADESIEVTEWSLSDFESSVAGDEGSGGSQEADEQSSSSGSNEDAEGSGNNDGSGSDETTPAGPIADVQGIDGEGPQQPEGGWGDVTGAGETKEARKAKLHHEQKAAVELAARASSDSSAAPFGLKGAKPVLLAGAAVGAAVGALAAVMGVMHLRRQQQQREEQSTLAAELPEPQTGREDFEAAAASTEPVADELASSSVDLEEALTRESESESEEEDAEEGAFANSSTVV